jgi:hypothetical protein
MLELDQQFMFAKVGLDSVRLASASDAPAMLVTWITVLMMLEQPRRGATLFKARYRISIKGLVSFFMYRGLVSRAFCLFFCCLPIWG